MHNRNTDSIITRARHSVAGMFAVEYVFTDGHMSPIDYLHSRLDDRTLHDRDSFWIRRYNDIADAFFSVLAIGNPAQN